MVESANPAAKEKSRQLITNCLPYAEKSFRIGISGAPGVGKSTFINALGKELLQQGYKPAILAIDPSSAVNRGSILGDKTRMSDLVDQERVYIRPTAAGGSLGGVSGATREAVILCEAAGFDVIIVETVGVGQSEIEVHTMTDLFLLLIQPGSGDELQGIKKGIMEMVDIVCVTKADGPQLDLAEESRRMVSNALRLATVKESGWKPSALTVSSFSSQSIVKVREKIFEFYTFVKSNRTLEKNREKQLSYWLLETARNDLLTWIYADKEIKNAESDISDLVLKRVISPVEGANRLFEIYKKRFLNQTSV